MAMTIPGGDFLTTGLNLISQSLLIPVVIILLIFVVVVVVSLGGLIYEYTSRTKVSVDDVSSLILEMSDCMNKEDLIVSLKDTYQDDNIQISLYRRMLP